MKSSRFFFSILILMATPIVTSQAHADPICVMRSNVTLRKGPGKKYPVSWTVPKFMPLQQIDRKGSWLKVQDLEGKTHWVYSASVSKKQSCLVVKSKTAKLRRGPGKDQPPADLASVDKYTPFLKLDRDGEWLQVQDDYKGVYWIHETNVWIPMGRMQMSF